MGDFNLLNASIKGLIILLWIYLYYTENITINRIIIFLIVFGFIIMYSRLLLLIDYVFNINKVQSYIKNNENKFLKLFNILIVWQKWRNPIIPFLTYTDKCLFKINRYITGTKLLNYNFVLYVIIKYLLMFGLVKLILYKYYRLWSKFIKLTIIDILFNRMYGLILSVLIFTNIFNNILLYVSSYGYGIWSFIIIYYIISMLCIIIELLFYYYFDYLYYIINKLKILKLLYLNFLVYTKMNMVIAFRNEYSLVGRLFFNIIMELIPHKSQFHEEWMLVEEFSKNRSIMSGRIAYFKPLTKTLSFKYFYESYKNDLPYNEIFKWSYEKKDKPSKFLYLQLIQLASLLYIQNQPIAKLMDWTYFEIKNNELFNMFNENEKLIINRNLQYLKKIDNLRAKLMYNIIWDIEYFYNENNKDYNWNYWIIQYNSMLEELIFKIDIDDFNKFDLNMIVKNTLIFYDPEKNMEYLNRLFNILGIVDVINNTGIKDNYYVSSKFNNYNKNYVELVKIMYKYDCKRWEENLCECNYLSSDEVEISYKIEDYFYTLRKEWEDGLKIEKLEKRNWRLLKEIEELMDNAN